MKEKVLYIEHIMQMYKELSEESKAALRDYVESVAAELP